MHIRATTDVPDAARAAALEHVTRRAPWGAVRQPPVAWATSTHMALPHRVYWLSYRDMLAEHALRVSADPRGWRFLLTRPGKLETPDVVGAVETWLDRGAWRVSSLRGGVTAEGMRTALQVAINEMFSDNYEFEPCYIWCRTTWSAALWLRPWYVGDGYVVPLSHVASGPGPHPTLMKVMEGKAFLDSLRAASRHRLTGSPQTDGGKQEASARLAKERAMLMMLEP